MAGYVLRRLGQSVVVLLLVTLMVFFTMHALPGDPVTIFLGTTATPEQIAHYTEVFGLDQPLIVQYVKWLAGLAHGELGQSIALSKPVGEVLPGRIVVTLSFTLPALVLSVLVGTTLGIWSAMRRGRLADSVISAVASFGVAAPAFVIGILLILLLGVQLKWLSISGYTPITEDPVAGIKKLVMPVIALSFGQVGMFTRQTRSAMLEVIGQDYIRTARSKGLKEKTVIVAHALRNALIPIVTLMGMSIGGLIGGTVLIEQLFTMPGVGSLLMMSIMNRDYMVLQNIVFFIAAAVLAANFLVDILYGYIDPRIRLVRK
ncbi:MAG: ABC transporter permease [Bifidobacteriaceae bacterium]|jgi:peptide/nickel transport system permease protein|nr:ABC transporter permease [Bifidobacteriaceae bacterium]